MTRLDERWEELARENAEFYIWTDPVPAEDFFASGERDAARVLAFAEPHLRDQSAALEMGCGVGRLTIPMSRAFERIVAVDIAPTMLTKLAANCAARDIATVTPMLAGDRWQTVAPIGFAYSRIVFQHIESWDVIADYFERTARALSPAGVFYVQFDTRPPNAAYRIRNALPDAVLPRTFRRGVRRVRRTAGQVTALAARCGLTTLARRGDGTPDTEFLFAPSVR